MHNLAICYNNLNYKQEALDLREEVREMKRMRVGETHSDTLIRMSSLAISYYDSGQKRKTLGLSIKTSEMSKRTQGDQQHGNCLITSLRIDYPGYWIKSAEYGQS